jgi:hypothetical protein
LPVVGRVTFELYGYTLIDVGSSWSFAFFFWIRSKLAESKIFVVAPESRTNLISVSFFSPSRNHPCLFWLPSLGWTWIDLGSRCSCVRRCHHSPNFRFRFLLALLWSL